MKYLECIIDSGLLRHVDKSSYIEAFEAMKIVEMSFAKGQIIFHEGDTIDRVCVIHQGSVRSEKTYPDGEVHIVSVFGENAIFGLEIAVSKKKTTPVDFIANENCRVLLIDAGSVFARNPFRDALQKSITEQLADDNIRMSHKIEILAERGLRDRVLVYLNILARKSGSCEVTVPMSREQLAQYLCVNRSALSNELNKMKREGIIDFRRHSFRLLKRTSEDPRE